MKSLLLIATLALAGCATTPARLIVTTDAALEVPAAKIELDNLATAKQVSESSVYFTGWYPIADRFVSPPFHEAMAAKLKAGLKPSGRGEALQIALIEASLYMDMHASDSVVFVGIAAAFRERPYKCTVTLNIKGAGGSQRREFEHQQVANRAFGDLEDKSGFVSKRQDALVKKVADALAQAR